MIPSAKVLTASAAVPTPIYSLVGPVIHLSVPSTNFIAGGGPTSVHFLAVLTHYAQVYAQHLAQAVQIVDSNGLVLVTAPPTAV